jgi:hypothetical protein
VTYKLEISPNFSQTNDYFPILPQKFNEGALSIHKARNELKIIELHGINTVVKSFKIPYFFNRIVYTYFRKSKAYKSYHNAIRLIELNVATPKPIGYIEFFENALLKNSYFAALHTPYDFTIREALHHTIDDYAAVLGAFAHYTYDLHQKGVWHLDYSPGNILIKRSDEGYLFNIVDINRMEFREITPLEGCENFNKLWARDEDIEIMAHEYAKLSGLDEALTITEMKRHNDENKRVKNFKKRLKKVLKGDFSTLA